MGDEYLGLTCEVCGFVGLEDGCDGYFYCQRCSSQAEGVRATAVENDHGLLFAAGSSTFQRRASAYKPHPFSQSQPPSQFWETLHRAHEDYDAIGPTEPADFATKRQPPTTTLSYEDYCTELRMRYVMGVQIMIQLQIKALVEKFNVCPIIVDMAQPIWFRILRSTKVFTHDWLNMVTNKSESHAQGEMEIVEARGKHKAEPHNLLGRRLIVKWYQSLSKTIPLSYSLAISFLSCHLAREAILPTDIIKWALEGELPYFAAFVEIEKQIGPPTNACPLKSSVMFAPVDIISFQKLESSAAIIALSIGLELPPVNFYTIASRFLTQLSLPVETILPHACRIYEWSMPAELWLSTNESRLPTRAYVLSILIVSIRILYNIHGFGKWEMSLSSCTIKEEKHAKKSKVADGFSDKEIMGDTPNLDATDILLVLESKYNELIDTSDYSKDLGAYLKYCKEVVFAGLEDLTLEDHDESEIIKDLMAFYKKNEDDKPKEITCPPSSSRALKGPEIENAEEEISTLKERAIRRMISNMKENKFTYIPPRSKVKRHDYLNYTRKKDKDGGAYVYAAHADYYILLRSCARVAQVDVRNMHDAATSFERRLAWLEKNIEHSLKQMPFCESCRFCNDDHDDMN